MPIQHDFLFIRSTITREVTILRHQLDFQCGGDGGNRPRVYDTYENWLVTSLDSLLTDKK